MWANNGGRNKKDEVWWTNGRGYIEGRIRDANGEKRTKGHRVAAEKKLSRPLRPGEDVHHKNGDKTDNRPENLEVISHGEHTRMHNLTRSYKRGYKMNLSDAERHARAERMRNVRLAAIAKAKGVQP